MPKLTTVTTERLKQIASGNAFTCTQDDESASMAAELLAVREAQSLSAGTQFKPVADLYEMQFEDGHTCAFHTDAEKAIQWLNTCDGNKVQEYVKLERLQEAFTAPPAPAVTDEISADQAYQLLMEKGGVMSPVDAVVFAWNACRAAMLNGGKS